MAETQSESCNVDVVLFDFGGVLAEEGFREGLMAIARLNSLEPEEFFKTSVDIIFRSGYVLGHCSENTFWNELRHSTGISGTDDTLRNEILSRFRLRSWMLELVNQLRERQVKLAILSDQTNWLDELNAKYGFSRHFDQVFNSYHMGKSKRDVAIFTDVLNHLGCQPHRSLFIDDQQGNVERAGREGLQTILFENRGSLYAQLRHHCPFLDED